MERPSIMTALDDALNALDRVDLQTSRMYMWMMFMAGFPSVTLAATSAGVRFTRSAIDVAARD